MVNKAFNLINFLMPFWLNIIFKVERGSGKSVWLFELIINKFEFRFNLIINEIELNECLAYFNHY